MSGWRFPETDGADSPWPIFERLLETHDELAVQAQLHREYEVRWAFVLKYDGDNGWVRGGKRIIGMAMMPRVQGMLGSLFDQLLDDALGYEPDFMILLNGEYWEAANDREREILVCHELLHTGQEIDQYGARKWKRDGSPVLGMLAHDLEEFDAIVRRYGEWKSDITSFRQALEEGRRPVDNGPPVRLVIPDPEPSPPPPPEPVVDGDLPPQERHVDDDLMRDRLTQGESEAEPF